jgi:Zn-dependent protease/CBS domain-containing protein
MRQDLRLGTFRGIAVGVNWSVAVILALFAWELAEYVLPAHAGHPRVADWVAGVIGATVLLLSLLAHELSHGVVARHNGVRVRSITLFVFGGVAQLEGEAHTAGADFRIAAVGPATSMALASLFALAQLVLVTTGAHGLPVELVSWLWQINLLLAVFNLIPAAPLDGGRVLRAALWHHWGDHVRASVAAARAGRAFAIVLVAFGVLVFFASGSLLGLWPALIGWFVYSGARGEEQYALVQGAVANLRVGQVMTPHPPSVSERSTVLDMATALWGYRGDAVAVTHDDGTPAGVVTAPAVTAVPQERRVSTTVAEIAVPFAEVPVARPEEPMTELLERMVAKQGHPALVLDEEGRVVGIVSDSDLQRAIAFAGGRQPLGSGR